MNNKNIVPIVFSFDNNFFIPAMVTFHSMIKNAHESTFYDIFIMMDMEKFRQANMEDLLSFERRYAEKCRMNFIEMKGFGGDFAIQEERFNFSVYYRLFIHKYVNYDKVIFSDVDIVIVKDLYEVYALDITDYYLGAIKQSLVNTMTDRKFKKYINKASGIKRGNYFNAGFLLLNLSKLREGNYTAEFIRLSKMGFNNNDQDILNLVFEDKVKYIPFKYCYAPVDSYFKKIDKSKLLEMFSPEELNEYENDPAIIHYVGTKPWNINTLDTGGLELDKYKLWWEEFYECLHFVNNQSIFELYLKLNNNVIQIANEYNESQTIGKTVKRLISILTQRLGIYQLLKSWGYVS